MDGWRTAGDAAAVIGGSAVVLATFLSAITTVVVPRGVPVRLTRWVFTFYRKLFGLRARLVKSYEERDRVMALYAPLSLISLPIVWLTITMAGYTAVFWGLRVRPLQEAFTTSGSSLLTLGFAAVHGVPTTAVAFSEATLGLILLALLITYLPSMYGAFSRREAQVAIIATFAGQPPSAGELIERFWVLEDIARLDAELWQVWTAWFVEIDETHTSLSALPFFRSPQSDRSWITAAGVVLDSGALLASTVDVPRSPARELCIRSGYLALRNIANFFRIEHNPNPKASDPISITRAEYDAICARLAAVGVPLKPDRDRAWLDFVGWRVNYDTVLITLAALVMAPYAPWISDRSPCVVEGGKVRRRR
ncbi:MAG TPA: hypothetical protein VHV82_14870 [Sporichthyaceae bacterium]|jgi:hypothetical protein|nr:hypothetical protein [Sporichthyaceae bacterium]